MGEGVQRVAGHRRGQRLLGPVQRFDAPRLSIALEVVQSVGHVQQCAPVAADGVGALELPRDLSCELTGEQRDVHRGIVAVERAATLPAPRAGVLGHDDDVSTSHEHLARDHLSEPA